MIFILTLEFSILMNIVKLLKVLYVFIWVISYLYEFESAEFK